MPAPGDLFARRYRLGRVLGRGAMGVVHEAVHEALGHRVAIKMLRGGLADDAHAVRRFEREARLAAKLASPHVVRVFDVDRTDDGAPYLVMELLEGRDLATEVEAREAEGPLPIATAVAWVCAIGDAMRAAHEAGIVHRDLKLSNVFLTNDGVVKVLDFGVASFRGGDGDASATASVAGTPRYMAPEQLLGEAPNPASDVWAAGVILYRLLTGCFPYDAPTMAGQMLAIMEGERPIEDLAPHVPKALASVVHRALGRTLEARCPSMVALRAALTPFAADAEPAAARRARDRDGDGDGDAQEDVPQEDVAQEDVAQGEAQGRVARRDDADGEARPVAARRAASLPETSRPTGGQPHRSAARRLAPIALGIALLVGLAVVFARAPRTAVQSPAASEEPLPLLVAPSSTGVVSASTSPPRPTSPVPPRVSATAKATRAPPAVRNSPLAPSAPPSSGDGFPNHL